MVNDVTVESFKKNITTLINILDNFFPNNWDFYLEKTLNNKYYIHIQLLYPEVLIKNEQGFKHTIKNLIVCLRLNNYTSDFIFIEKVHGTKSYFTHEEFMTNTGKITEVGYVHSHLAYSSGYLHTADFCLGELQMDFKNRNERNFEEYIVNSILNIDSLVEWESLEGVPYKYISSLSSVSNKEFSAGAFSQGLINTILNNFTTFEGDIVFTENRYKIILNNKYLSFLKKEILKYLKEKDYPYFLYIEAGGKKYAYSSKINETKDIIKKIYNDERDIPYTYIGNKKLSLIIEDCKETLPKIEDYKVAEKVINEVTKKYEEKIYRIAVKRYTNRAKNKNLHI
ncbi:MAG: hypothetical protein ACRC0V_11700 [Fusobacteriaceae bacterium]